MLKGRYCRLERLDPDRHASELYAADRLDTRGESWTYLAYGPFGTLDEYRAWAEPAAAGTDPLFYTVISTDPNERPGPVGVLSLLRIEPAMGVIEVGHVHYSPLLQRRRAATEAQFLLASYVFDELGYRRYEWKCDALNAPSRAAAQRLGYSFEGIFRQAVVVKGRNRDTAWYSMIDDEWPRLRERFARWLHPDNFDADGRQLSPLGAADPAPERHGDG